jgi:ATP-binding cassette subfamily B protein
VVQNIIRILKIAKPLYHIMAGLVALILVVAIIQQISPVLSSFIVDEIVANITEGEGDIQRLAILIAIGFAANLVSIILNSLSERLGDHFAGRIRKFLTEKFYHKVLTLPQSYFDGKISGKIVNQLNRGIFVIQSFMNTASNFILPTLVQSIITVGILAYYNLAVAAFTALLFPIYLGLSYYSSLKWGKEEVKKNKREDLTRGRIQEAISNIKLVKGYTNEENEWDYVANKQTEINDIYARQSSTFHWFDFGRNLSLQIILLIINIIVFYNTFQGILTIGELVLIVQLVNQARRPLFAMSFILTQIQNAESGSKEYFEILELESSENYDKPTNKKERVEKAVIEMKDISFSYEDSQAVLKNFSLKFDKDEKVALVGKSGAGKSTVINLILKFYDPQSGEITFNGESYSDIDHQFIRRNIALVFQDNELFSSTIRENVAYGQDASDEDITAALKQANAWEFVEKLKEGIDTEIGERGLRLSGGQKQRIQIARAIIKDAPVLILDEATSNLDAESEHVVQEALENLMEGRLTIIIAHRFSTIQDVDRIVVIEDGAISAQGSPDKLAKQPGLYSTLLRYQLEGDKKLLKNFDLY